MKKGCSVARNLLSLAPPHGNPPKLPNGYYLKLPKEMPDKILIDQLGNLVTNVNLRWKLHKDLFQGHEQYQMFNQAGPTVWNLLRESLFDSIMMDLGRFFMALPFHSSR
jgi:hypothetical protein